MHKLIFTVLLTIVLATVAFAQDHDHSKNDFGSLMDKANKALNRKDYVEAEKLFVELIELRPDDGGLYYLSGMIYFEMWKLDDASKQLALSIKYEPNNLLTYYNKARADRFRKANKEGLVAIRKVLELKPNFAQAYLLLGDLLSDPAEKKAAYDKALLLSPNLLKTYLEQARELREKYTAAKIAEELYRTVMKLDPNKMIGRFDLGRMLVEQGRLAEARTLWNERTSDEDSGDPKFITMLESAEKTNSNKKP